MTKKVVKAELKVPNGKLIRVSLSVKEGKLSKVVITGDFFMHPEEVIELLEMKLNGVSADRKSITKAITNFFKEGEVKILGASPEDFVQVIMGALKSTSKI